MAKRNNCPNCETEILGTIYTNNKGYNVQIIEIINKNLVNVKFEDGTIMTKYLNSVLKGTFKAPLAVRLYQYKKELSALPKLPNTNPNDGVSYVPKNNKWQANITVNKRCYWLGYYETKEEALKVRKEFENICFIKDNLADDSEEQWKTIKECPNYSISNYGRIKSNKNNYTIKTRLTKSGRERVGLRVNGSKRHFSVHRLVASAFIPNPLNLPQVNHKDENPSNNHVDNLEWCTAKYNVNYGTAIQRRAISCGKKVRCIETNVIYDSISSAARETNTSEEKIRNELKGKTKNPKKTHWEYVEKQNNNRRC